MFNCITSSLFIHAVGGEAYVSSLQSRKPFPDNQIVRQQGGNTQKAENDTHTHTYAHTAEGW